MRNDSYAILRDQVAKDAIARKEQKETMLQSIVGAVVVETTMHNGIILQRPDGTKFYITSDGDMGFDWLVIDGVYFAHS